MTFDKLIGAVQHRAQLASTGDALRAVEAVLRTLGERLDPGEAKDLASQLPRELAEYLQTDEHSVKMSLGQFFQKVSGRAGVDVPAAVYQVRVVFELLQEAVSAGEIGDVRSQLPPEWGELFEAGSRGQIRLGEPAHSH
jgi:uncharacterized protein (DUF2267 family)